MAVPSLTRMDSLEGNSNYFFTSMDQGLTLPPKICQNLGSEDTVDYFAEGERAVSPIPSWFEPDASPPPRTKRRMTPGTAVPESLTSSLQSFQSGVQVRTVTADYLHCSSENHRLRVQEKNDDSAPTAPSLYNPSADDDIQIDDWDSCDLFGDPHESPPGLSADGSGSNSRQSSMDFATSSNLNSSCVPIIGAGLDCIENKGVRIGLQEKDLACSDKGLSVPCNGLSLPNNSLSSLNDASGNRATKQQQQPNISTILEQVPQILPAIHQLSQSIELIENEQTLTRDVQPSFKPTGKMPTKTFLRKRKREEPQDVSYKHSILLSLLTRLAGPALQVSINAHIKKLQTDGVQHNVHPSLGPSFDIVRRKIQEDEVFRNEAIAYIMQLPEETDDELFGEYAVDSNFTEQIRDLAPQDLRRMLVAKDKRIDTCTRKWQKYKSERDTAWTIINQQRNADKWRREREEDSEEDPSLPGKSNSSPDTSQRDAPSTKTCTNSSLDDSSIQTNSKDQGEIQTHRSSSIAAEAARVTRDQERQAFEDMKVLVGVKEARISALELELERLKSKLEQQTKEQDPDTPLETAKPTNAVSTMQDTLPSSVGLTSAPQLNTISSHLLTAPVSGNGSSSKQSSRTHKARQSQSRLQNNCFQLHNSSQKLYSSPYVDSTGVNTCQTFPYHYPSGTYISGQSAPEVYQSGLLSSDRKALNHQGATGQILYTSRQISTTSLPETPVADCHTSAVSSSRRRPYPAGQESASVALLSPKLKCEDLTRTNDVAAYQLGGRRPAWMAQPAIAVPPICHVKKVNSTPTVVDLTQDLPQSFDEDGWDDFDNDLDKALQEREEEEEELIQEREEDIGVVSEHWGEQENNLEQEQDFSELERELEFEMGRVPE